MRYLTIFGVISICAGFTGIQAQETTTTSESKPAEKKALVKGTFLITGLHCPPCTRTVEASLRSIKGVRTVKVDWNTRNAKVEFDESILSAQQLADSIGRTPHMMGANLHYGAWLALKVDGVKGEEVAKKTQKALEGVSQVARVSIYPKQEAVGIAFKPQGKVTTDELVQVLKEAGVTASAYP